MYSESMRSRALALQTRLVGVVLGALVAPFAASVEPIVSTHEAAAETEICVGAELQATEDVQLSRAEIAKGSRVSVTKVQLRQGDPSSVDISLADGQIIKQVGIGTIHNFF